MTIKSTTIILFCLFAGIVAKSQNLVYDTTFGTDGITVTPIGPDTDYPTDMEIQTDGKLLATGYGWPENSNNTVSFTSLVRYLPNGSLDTGFGTAGIITEQINSWSRAYAVKTQSDGKIIIAGHTKFTSSKNYTFLIRYTTNGTRDNTFGDNGIILFTNPEGPSIENNYFYALTIQSDDKIIAGGLSYIFSEELEWHNDYVLYRFNSDGTPDIGFGTNGKTIANFDYLTGDPFIQVTEIIQKLALQPDGKIITLTHAFDNYIVSRLNTDGTFDTSFGESGHATIPLNYFTTASLSIQNDGKIVISSSTYPPNSTPTNTGIDRLEHMLIRLTSEGNLDTGFGTNGKVTSIFPDFAFRDGSAIILPNGKILAAGYPFTPFLTTQSLVLIRYNSNGTYDDSFGTNGRQFFNFGASQGFNVSDMILLDDNKIVLSGATGLNLDFKDFMLLRLQEEETTGLNNAPLTPLTLYPNPTATTLTLANANNLDIEKLAVIDVTGKILIEQQSNALQIDVQQLPAGMYFLEITANGTKQHTKFIKE